MQIYFKSSELITYRTMSNKILYAIVLEHSYKKLIVLTLTEITRVVCDYSEEYNSTIFRPLE